MIALLCHKLPTPNTLRRTVHDLSFAVRPAYGPDDAQKVSHTAERISAGGRRRAALRNAGRHRVVCAADAERPLGAVVQEGLCDPSTNPNVIPLVESDRQPPPASGQAIQADHDRSSAVPA